MILSVGIRDLIIKQQKPIFLTICFLMAATCFGFLILGKPLFSLFVLLSPLAFFTLVYFFKHPDYVLLGAFFVEYYVNGDLRILPANLITFACFILIFYYRNSDYFNEFTLPKPVSIISALFILSLIISSIVSVHASALSVYMSTVFITFMIAGYVFFKVTKDTSKIDSILKLFTYFVFVESVIIIAKIFATGNLRSVGISGYAIIDFSVISLLILLIRFFILDKNSGLQLIALTTTFLILITTQSRFAWLGFLVTFIYGLFISYSSSDEAKLFLKKKTPAIVFTFLILLGLVFATGLHNIILIRVLDIDLNFFNVTEDKMMVQNSLESRLLIWIVAYNAFVNNPIFGMGYFMFYRVSEAYNMLPLWMYDIFVQGLDVHTTYFNILIDVGIFGFLIFVSMFGIIFYYSFKAIKLSNNTNSKRNSIILNVIIFFVIFHSIYSGAFTFGLNAYVMFMFFGLTIANYQLVKSAQKNNT